MCTSVRTSVRLFVRAFVCVYVRVGSLLVSEADWSSDGQLRSST